MYGTIVPAYRLTESIDSLTQLAHSTREQIETRTDEYRAEQFEGIFRYVQGKEKEGAQAVIRGFRRNIEKVVGIDCSTVDSEQYELPEPVRLRKGKYELQMECGGKTLIVPLGEIELR